MLQIDVVSVVVVVVKSSFFSLILFLVKSEIVFDADISISISGFVIVESGRDSLHFRISLQKLLNRGVLVAAISARLSRVFVAEDLRRNETSRRRLRDDDCDGFFENVVGIVVFVDIVFFLFVVVVVVVVVVVQDKT